MANNDSTLNIHLDTNQIENGIKNLLTGLVELKNISNNILSTIKEGFDYSVKVNENISQSMETSINVLSRDISNCALEITNEIKNVFESVQALSKGQESDSIINAATKPIDWMLQIIGLATSAGSSKLSAETRGESTQDTDVEKTLTEWMQKTTSKTLELPAPGESSYGKTTGDDGSSLGLVSGGLMDLGSSLPSPESLVEMATCIGDVAIKLKESAVAWGQELAAKVASRAEDLKIIAVNTVEHAKAFGIMIGQLVASAAAWAAETAAKVANTAAQWAQIAATTAWQAICVAATAVTAAFGAAVNFLTSPIGLVVVAITALIAIVVLLVKNWDTVKAAALSVWETIKGAFGKAGEWFKTTLLDPLSNGFKNMANGIIGFINGLITGAVKGINGLIALLNKLQFTVPDWVPGLGGKSLGFHIKTISAPQIPYLAKGAVLPANKPFLAVVGDQRHGTNVEAPLATIQEAVALVMDDHIAAMMAGFEALLQEQRATRRCVEGIRVGDDVIGRAVQRYNRKMAVVKGGY